MATEFNKVIPIIEKKIWVKKKQFEGQVRISPATATGERTVFIDDYHPNSVFQTTAFMGKRVRVTIEVEETEIVYNPDLDIF